MNSVKKLSSKDWTLQNINDFLNTNSKIVLDKSTESIVKKQREKLEKLLKNKSENVAEKQAFVLHICRHLAFIHLLNSHSVFISHFAALTI